MRISTQKYLSELIKELYTKPDWDDPALPKFVEHFKEKFQDSLVALILYGSMISPTMKKEDSLHDFYVVVDSYRRAHTKILHNFLNMLLPPNVYLENVKGKACKYNVITLRHLEKYIITPKEIYIVGRFAKRLYFAHTRDERVLNKIAYFCMEAMDFNLRYTIPLMGEKFSLEELVKETLDLSYKGEVRVESGPKIDEIFAAHKDFYIEVYSKLLEEYRVENEGVIVESDGVFTKVSETIPTKKEVISFLKSSRRRGVLRWPKGVITFKGYREYLERKVEKAGEKVELSKLDRRFPLLFGWRHIIRFWREGKLKPRF